MSTNRGPNPLSVAWAILRAKRVARPAPGGQSSADHTDLKALLEILKDEGIARLPPLRGEITDYRNFLATVDPDDMSRDGALAFWLNLYNAGALDLAAEAVASGKGSVLRVPGAFTREWATIAGEALSLTEIEHGKIRRFGDPRIHGALVCGSASCPSLRFEPYEAAIVGEQLDDQLRFFSPRAALRSTAPKTGYCCRESFSGTEGTSRARSECRPGSRQVEPISPLPLERGWTRMSGGGLTRRNRRLCSGLTTGS